MSAPQFNNAPTPNSTATLTVDHSTAPSTFVPPSEPQPPSSSTENSTPAPSSAPEKSTDEAPPVVLPAATKTERFFLTAADQASGSRNERLNMVIRSKYEAGLLKPYNYVKGYARLSRWMDKKSVFLLLEILVLWMRV